jgi:hypothetical protein
VRFIETPIFAQDIQKMNEKEFEKLVASVKQAGQIKRGRMKPGRVTYFKPADIKAIRKRLNKSQSEFALMIWGEPINAAELGTGQAPTGGSRTSTTQSGCGKP